MVNLARDINNIIYVSDLAKYRDPLAVSHVQFVLVVVCEIGCGFQ